MGQSYSVVDYAKRPRSLRWGRASLVHAGVGVANFVINVVLLGGHLPMDWALFARYLVCGTLMFLIAGFGIWYGIKGVSGGNRAMSLVGILANIPFFALGCMITYIRLTELLEAYSHHGGIMMFGNR